jgi:hypothetical protein
MATERGRNRRRRWLGAVLLGALAAGCGRRLELPVEPDATGTPSGEVAYVVKYRWDGMAPLADLVVTRGQVLFGIADSTRVLSWFSDWSEPRQNTTFTLPESPSLRGDVLQRPVQLCEGAHNTLWVAYTRPYPVLAQFDLGVSPPRLVDSSYVRQDSILAFGGIAADRDSGFVYVSDSRRSTISKYAPSASGGRRVTVLATPGNGDRFVQQPHGIYFFQDSLLVADTGKDWLQVISADVPLAGRGQVTGPESEPLQLRGPADVWADPNGAFYVTDTGNARVLQLNAAGRIREVVTALDPESPPAPSTLVASPRLVWVVDPGRSRLTIYQINTATEELP